MTQKLTTAEVTHLAKTFIIEKSMPLCMMMLDKSISIEQHNAATAQHGKELKALQPEVQQYIHKAFLASHDQLKKMREGTLTYDTIDFGNKYKL